MKKPTVILYKKAYQSIIFSLVEVYKKEGFGYLFGNREKFGEIVHIRQAQGLQTAKRRLNKVDICHDGRLEPIHKHLKLNFMGDFHSHTDYFNEIAYAYPGAFDRENVEPVDYGEVQIIVALNEIPFREGESSLSGMRYFDNCLENIFDIPARADANRRRKIKNKKTNFRKKGLKLEYSLTKRKIKTTLKAYYIDKNDGKIKSAFLEPANSLQKLIKLVPLGIRKNGNGNNRYNKEIRTLENRVN